MKRAKNVAIAAILSLILCAAWVPVTKASGIFDRLGVTEETAREGIRMSLMNQGIYTQGAMLKSIALGDRADMVRQLGRYAKDYTKTAEFLDAYREYREGRRPSPPQEPKTTASLKAEQREQLKQAIAETEENMKTLPAELKPTMREVLETFRQQLKDLDDPNNPMFSAEMDAMLRQGGQAEEQDYRNRLAQWEEEYPATPERLIRGWLHAFLKDSQGVDFSAKLVPEKNGLKKFANPGYEAKPATWKMCYRAGREATEAARAFAQEWIAELGE